MTTIYLVKSINLNNSGNDITSNLKAFTSHASAEKFMRSVEKQIDEDSDSEWLEIETFETV